jgi:uncharacterized protein (DUF736 family)
MNVDLARMAALAEQLRQRSVDAELRLMIEEAKAREKAPRNRVSSRPRGMAARRIWA